MDSCNSAKLSKILCNLKNSSLGGASVRYIETLDEIGGDSNHVLSSGAVSYTITILQGTVDHLGTTLPEGSWSFSAPMGGTFGSNIIDGSNSTSAYVHAIYPE